MSEDRVDGRIKVGDACHDLVERGKVQVVGKAAETVAQFDNRQDDFDLETYKAHPLLDVTIGDPVWTCVYLPEKPSANLSGTYDFPGSRLARVPVEEANEDLRRIQQDLIVDLLATVVTGMREETDLDEEEIGAVADRVGGTLPELVDEAMELADVDAVIGGEDGGE